MWVSEIMLQQTQVATVIPYFERFMARFPDVPARWRRRPLDEVLHLWSGLGYYARARNLHRAAHSIRDLFGGEFPHEFDAVAALPGIGRSTAGAILALAGDERFAILDGNVRRVLARYFAVDGPVSARPCMKRLWELAERARPHGGGRLHAGDHGSRRHAVRAPPPACAQCPLATGCAALAHRSAA